MKYNILIFIISLFSCVSGDNLKNEQSILLKYIDNPFIDFKLYNLTNQYHKILINEKRIDLNDTTYSKKYIRIFNPNCKFNFILKNNNLVDISLYSMTGKQIANLFSDSLNYGSYYVDLSGSKIGSDLFVMRFNLTDSVILKKVFF